MKYSMHSYAAQFCEAAVHEQTGEVRIRRWVGAFDTGRILNPKTAVSQFRGGIIMGIGMALTEETMFDDRTGRIMNASLAEYHVPVQADVPFIDIVYTDVARSADAARRPRHRRNRHHGRGGRDCECRLSRNRQARHRPPDHARQAAVKVDPQLA